MLYLIESQGFLKIGFSDNIDKRIDSYHTENPNFKVLKTREGDRKDESYLHLLFKDYIDHREWMKYEEFIINLFDKITLPSETVYAKELKSLKNKIDNLSKENKILDHMKEFANKQHEELLKEHNILLHQYNDLLKEHGDMLRRYKDSLKENIELKEKIISLMRNN